MADDAKDFEGYSADEAAYDAAEAEAMARFEARYFEEGRVA